ncbi:BMP-binding endothelial regulator protein-like isoform X2 [Clavelina lepadiformis]|uniref:BMP-binding endothelial regulator protein-like isoform X2 n=1 Tax=Clavelina lepadiformis TaxID=159417 RepID=UPI0040434C14
METLFGAIKQLRHSNSGPGCTGEAYLHSKSSDGCRICLTSPRTVDSMKEKCTNEGGKVEIERITSDPCITCLCKRGTVKCSRQRCPSLTCHILLKGHDQCCPYYCQECVAGNETFQSSRHWNSFPESSCDMYNCNDGILMRSQKQCHVPCNNPLPPSDGQCCPSCSGCQVGGRSFFNGQRFLDPADPCIECSCEHGNARCSRKVCPVLACGGRMVRTKPGNCCPQCVGKRYVFDLGTGDCWFQRDILRHLEEVTLDVCTQCTCMNGTVVCHRQTCPEKLSCAESEHIYPPFKCCPICHREELRNCTDEIGEQRKHGTTWSQPRQPCQSCRCHNGTTTCTEMTCDDVSTRCGRGQVLENVPGKCCKTCVDEPGICTVFGDPHYRTFDGRPFNFQGDCSYMLAKDCREQNFTVTAQNDAKRSRAFAWTKTIFLHLYATDSHSAIDISLHQHLIAKLNGRKLAIPYHDQHLMIVVDRGYLLVWTGDGLSLKWDGDSFLEIGASPRYRGALCGLCGNFNGFPRDDLIGSDGRFKRDKDSFAESWRIGEDRAKCSRPNYDARPADPCSRSLSLKLRARRKCSVFKSPKFRPCYDVVDPTEYYRSCLTDTCECPRARKCACEAIKAYTDACARRSVAITWKRQLYCKKLCRNGKVYSSCGPACKMTCKNYQNKRRTKRCMRRPCVAGCHCAAGYVMHKKRCVKTSACSQLTTSPNKFHPKENPFTSILDPWS